MIFEARSYYVRSFNTLTASDPIAEIVQCYGRCERFAFVRAERRAFDRSDCRGLPVR